MAQHLTEVRRLMMGIIDDEYIKLLDQEIRIFIEEMNEIQAKFDS